MNRIELNREQFERLVCAWRDDATDPNAVKYADLAPQRTDDLPQLLPDGNFRRECEAMLASRGRNAPTGVRYRLLLSAWPAPRAEEHHDGRGGKVVHISVGVSPQCSTARYLAWEPA